MASETQDKLVTSNLPYKNLLLLNL